MSVKSFYIVIILTFLSCKKSAKHLDIEIIGHGGFGLEIPSSIYHGNSKEAVLQALLTESCNGTELDVHLSASNSLWLVHDGQLSAETTGEGCIETQIDDYLSTLRFKSLEKEKLRRLIEIEELKSTSKRIFLDVKHYDECSQSILEVERMKKALNDFRSTLASSENVILVISNPAWIGDFIDEGWRVIYGSDDISSIKAIKNEHPQLYGFLIRNKIVDKDEVKDLQEKGKRVYLYEIRAPKEIKAAGKKNPTGVLTDDVHSTIIAYK